MDLTELLAQLGAIVGTDKDKAKEVATAMRNHAEASLIAQDLINFGAGKKKSDMDREVTRLTTAKEAVEAELEALRTEFDEFKAKTPDVAAVEARLKGQYDRRLAEKDGVIDTQARNLKGALTARLREKLVNKLSTTHRVDPDYAGEVLAARFGDRFEAQDDGSVRVLQQTGEEEIDGDTEDARIATLAAQIAKDVPAKYVDAAADRGGGTRKPGGATTSSSSDDVADAKRRSGVYAL